MGEVIRLKNKDGLKRTFDEILSREDSIVDFAVMVRFRNDPKIAKETDVNYVTLHRFWGEDSTINILGLAHYMCDLISEYLLNEGTLDG